MKKPLLWVLGALMALVSQFAAASASGVVISQVYGGGGNSGATYRADFIEIYNAGTAPVSLSGWSVQYASAAGTSWQVTNLPSLTLQPGQYALVQEALGTGGTVDLPTPDATGTIAMSGTAGKVALVSSTTALTGGSPTGAQVVDLVGFGSTASFFEGSGPTPAPSNTTAVLRLNGGCTDTDNNAADFAAGAPTPRNSAVAPSPCGAPPNAPIVASCPAFAVPAGTGGAGVVSASDADGTVNSVTPGTLPAGVSISAFSPAPAAGGTANASIQVANTVPAGSASVTLTWRNDQGQSATCTVNITIAPTGLTAIYTIQGSGATSPLAGQAVLTSGVVTKLTNNGFYLQDPTGDGNPLTSDGIYVFTSTAPTVQPGQLIQVAGTVTEFNTGSTADTAAHTITELTNVGGIQVVGSGSVTPVVITLPVANRDDLERYEGMVVTINGPLTVSQNFFQAQYGQVTLSAGGRLETPTNRLRPGPAALALDDENRRRSIILDDGSSIANPNPIPYIGEANTLRAGDTVASVTGVIDFGLAGSGSTDVSSYKIQPVLAPVFTRANPRTLVPPTVGGNIRVASFNVLNFFTTFTNGQTASGQTGQGCTLGTSTSAGNCRGADSLAEFIRQRTKIVEAIAAINPDAVGLMEIQNNGSVAAQNLVDALNAKVGAGTYAVVPPPPQGTGTDAIKVAMLYQPGRLTLAGPAVSDVDPINDRPPMAQTFIVPGGEQFTLVVNHLKSKLCSGATGLDADQGDLQGCYNDRRLKQAKALRRFVGLVHPYVRSPNAILVGDFNAYAQEDPIAELLSRDYMDQIGRFNTLGYSYVFNSGAGRLDHALVTSALAPKVTGAVHWHINADEPNILDYNLEGKPPACNTCAPDLYTATPYRASDHDPVVIGLQIGTGPASTARMPGRSTVRTPAPVTTLQRGQ